MIQAEMPPKNLTRRIPTMTVKPMQYPPQVQYNSMDEENDSESEEVMSWSLTMTLGSKTWN